MGKTLRVQSHLNLSEIDEYIRTCKNTSEVRRWMVIRHALSEPSTSEAISQHIGFSAGWIRQLICTYNQEGPSALRRPKRMKEPNAYLSKEAEKNFSFV